MWRKSYGSNLESKIQQNENKNILRKLGGAFGSVGNALMSGISWS
jgi:hypothetical protein